ASHRPPARQDPRGRARRVHRGARRRRPAPRARARARLSVGDALARATARLAEAGVESARLEAELLLAHACGECPRAFLYAELGRELTAGEEAGFEAHVA